MFIFLIDNYVRDAGLVDLLPGLEMNSTLLSLDLRSESISVIWALVQTFFLSLSRLFPRFYIVFIRLVCSNLRWLSSGWYFSRYFWIFHFIDNRFSSIGIGLISFSIRNHKSLQYLNLSSVTYICFSFLLLSYQFLFLICSYLFAWCLFSFPALFFSFFLCL